MIHGYLMPSPLGDVALRFDGDVLTGLFFDGQKYFPSMPFQQMDDTAPDVVLQVKRRMDRFFAGEPCDFHDIDFELRGTPFQKQVWAALWQIPYGNVVSYGTIAERMGLDHRHSRAVGAAVGKNPISVIVPCHRVLGGSGSLTGYAGGIGRKSALLALEKTGELLPSAHVLPVQVALPGFAAH
jgi:methylated-DNA-[protein]-cysteine S-methyltransferase